MNDTGTQSVGDVLLQGTARFQKPTNQSQPELIAKAPVIEKAKYEKIDIEKVVIKPTPKSWEELEKILIAVINFKGVWARARELYEQGYGAELETLAEVCLETHREKYPYQMFAVSISKVKGHWENITLKVVAATWEVRQNVVTVMSKLKIRPGAFNYVLSLAWKLKGTILRFLALATEQGQGIENPAAYFLGIAKNNKADAAAAV